MERPFSMAGCLSTVLWRWNRWDNVVQKIVIVVMTMKPLR